MIEFEEAKLKILRAIKNQELCIIVGKCFVSYKGRASSKLPKGQRLIIIKADLSISIHENRLIRPTNYMINGKISCEINEKELIIESKRLKPKENLIVNFFEITDIKNYDMQISNDLRLTGSEKELNDALMDDLNFLEPGLKPINQQQVFRKGICDIIAEDAEGKLVVIELKRRLADYASVTQLKRYVEQVEKMKGIKTRGILLAPEIRKSAMELLHTYNLEFFSYDFEIEERSKIKGIGKSQQKLSDYDK
ncbi:MAG: endonuclease NucS [Candidatus ainarchaeum sp.]|nr:endonuclease NucS [Candidatus ainarchaeum sp.]